MCCTEKGGEEKREREEGRLECQAGVGNEKK